MHQLNALIREASSLGQASLPVAATLTGSEAEVDRVDANLQRLSLLRRFLRGLSGDDAPA